MASCFLLFGTSGNIHDPPKPIFLDFGYTKLLRITRENSINNFGTHYFGNLKSSKEVEPLENTRAEKSLRSVLSIRENLECGTILSKIGNGSRPSLPPTLASRWSGAGVGVGMSRGDFEILMFQDVP